MREVNFSIPNANKASVGITPALYDRRALDCTSTLPLINSLNNLAYLTTSSARIRDILTIDGGVERLVCILKEGRSKEAMEMWKWNLAFQCIVNIGVRGSETVRTRVVEADMVPVVATVLDNYIQAVEKCHERSAAESRQDTLFQLGSSTSRSAGRPTRVDSRLANRLERSRRPAPPPIEIPQSQLPRTSADVTGHGTAATAAVPNSNILNDMAPSSSSASARRQHFSSPIVASSRMDDPPEPALSAAPFANNVSGFGIRAVRDIDRLPSMLPTLHADLSSQPQSPTTPSAPAHAVSRAQPRRRPSIRHQLSISGTVWDDEEQNDDSVPEVSDTAETSPEPIVEIQTDIVMQDIGHDDRMLEGSATPVAHDVPTVNVADTDAFIAPSRHSLDGSINNPTTTPAQTRTGFNPVQPLPPVNVVNATPPNMRHALDSYPGRLPLASQPSLVAALPRDEDVIMALQLLAYVSKYCNLRSFFQASHLVPRLKIGAELKMLDADYDPNSFQGPTQEELDEEWDNEFVVKPDEPAYNIFPLIEKFTIRNSSSRHGLQPSSPQQSESMQYWAGVVMRNLCRKDETRGGIRQCAYWKCGKWEEFTRQFAKCRRCRRTKYCSKECQKGAWGTHRFWCVAAEEGREGEASGSRHGHHAHHHHHSRREGQAQAQAQTQAPASRLPSGV